MNLLLEAQNLRHSEFFETIDSFKDRFSHLMSKPYQEISSFCYRDLPQFSKLESTELIQNGEDLIKRYNLALAQGILLKSQKLTCSVGSLSLPIQRKFLSLIKFHQLVVEFTKFSVDCIEFELSGPLAIFENTSTYGFKLAKFFPHLIHLPDWKIQAEIAIGKKNALLQLSSKNPLHSFYQSLTGYYPEELLFFARQWEEKWKDKMQQPFTIQLEVEPVRLDGKNLMIPDFNICCDGKEPYHVELFHRWHSHQLLNRLRDLDNNKNSTIFIIGVCRSFKKKPDVFKKLESSKIFSKQGFYFQDFPTTKQIFEIIKLKHL
jgi:predicted nuclease of restriction endonuclease-like RecB superfamily